jgi:hypothetical protein
MRFIGERVEINMCYKRLTVAFFLLFFFSVPLLWGGDAGISVHGAGTTILTGGGPGTAPITTKIGINFENGSGNFDCLALAPTPAAGTQGSGIFHKNTMYVTGPITEVRFQGSSAVLTGTAAVTGVGAGSDVPFTVTADRGGPGTRVVLVVSGLTFVETMLEGSITFSGKD